jgi:integrase
VLFEGGAFDIRSLLTGLIARRRGQGATDQDYLFAWRDDEALVFRPGLRAVLLAANALLDPTTGKERVAYSFRHLFATLLISHGLSVRQIAARLGTSSDMIERHYNPI